LLDDPNSDRPKCRTAIVARELSRYNIDIAVLSETRRADKGHLREEQGGYTFFWKGKPANDRQVHGIGFAIKNQIVSRMTEFPAGINERLMTLCLQLANNSSATVMSAYTPTLAAEEEQKLRSILSIRVALKHRKQPKTVRRQYNIKSLQIPKHREDFQTYLSEKFANLAIENDNTSIEDDWQALKETIHVARKESIGVITRRHQDWFDENNAEIKFLLDRKRKVFCDWQNHPTSSQKRGSFRRLKAEAQKKIREIKNKWWEEKAKEIQQFVDNHDMR
uniref:Endonuclease/exonuclease/phosphatase domain-containing protein n=1 Tax=Latimeria chalumnae TaxID=7897 RepID=H3A8R6_LATCH